jgi:hypothetical protein
MHAYSPFSNTFSNTCSSLRSTDTISTYSVCDLLLTVVSPITTQAGGKKPKKTKALAGKAARQTTAGTGRVTTRTPAPAVLVGETDAEPAGLALLAKTMASQVSLCVGCLHKCYHSLIGMLPYGVVASCVYCVYW